MKIAFYIDHRRSRRGRERTNVLAGAGIGAGLLFFLDPVSGRRRRKLALDRAAGTLRHGWRRAARQARGVAALAQGQVTRVTRAQRGGKQLDDATLARKIETEIFRDPEVPKGQINVNVQRGVVQLRGEVATQDMLEALVERSRAVQGVLAVESLLHLPDRPAPMHQ